MAASKKGTEIRVTLVDEAVPIEHRRRLLAHLAEDESEESTKTLRALLAAAATGHEEALAGKKSRELTEMIRALEQGALRSATFIEASGGESAAPRALVVLDDGSSVCAAVPDAGLASSLRCGEPVLVDREARAVLRRGGALRPAGEEARLERALPGGRVEVSVRDDERYVFYCAADLAARIASGEVAAGQPLLVCVRRRLALDALPPRDGLGRFRFLSREPAPDVLVARDVGAPPRFIEEAAQHVRIEMREPALHRRYRRRPAMLTLIEGPSGGGKSFCVRAAVRRILEEASSATGIALDALPPRILRLRPSQVFSKWFGESDRNAARFFDEALEIASQTVRGPDGRTHRLPVICILEEVDGLARARGDDPIYDRVMTTLLDRLDTTNPEIAGAFLVVFATTNVLHAVDPAFVRRVGGTVERVGRLDEDSFAAVLAKQIRELPVAPHNGDDPEEARGRLVREVTAWIWDGSADEAQVEIHLIGSQHPTQKRRRDFLTGGLVDRAVQDAAARACRAEWLDADRAGLTRELLAGAFDRQIAAIAGSLDPANAHLHVDLPEGARVASVRRAERPSVHPYQLERAI